MHTNLHRSSSANIFFIVKTQNNPLILEDGTRITDISLLHKGTVEGKKRKKKISTDSAPDLQLLRPI